MPPRGKRPGYKRNARSGLRYWYAKQVMRNTMGYPDPCIALPVDADDETIDRLCQDYTASLRQWVQDALAADPEEPAPHYDARRVYDGSVRSVCRIYQEHPYSDFRYVKSNTRRFYAANLKIVELTVGGRQVRNLTIVDCKNWYAQWRKPAVADGPERIDRAHDAISVFKMALNFCAALRLPHCEQLAAALEKVKFEKGGAREQELTYAQTINFIETARNLADKGVIERSRALSMSVGVAAQLDLMLRQRDVIGEYPKSAVDLEKAQKRGAAVLNCDGRMWAGYFTWEAFPGWRWRMRTSKSRYRSLAEFDLTKRSLLFPLLEQVPFGQRHGAVIKGANGHPITEKVYREGFRRIARAAGIPDDVWSMDARAGGATEAHEREVPIELISESLTHSNTETTVRYIRRRAAKLDRLAEEVSRKRAAESGNKGGKS